MAQFGNLNKFGVPVDDSGTAGILMPKLKYRFRVKMMNFGGLAETKEFTQNVMNVSRPKLNHEEIEIHSYNSKVFVAGKHTWDAITIVLRDDIQNSVARICNNQMHRQLNHFNQQSPLSGGDYKFNMRIEILDGQTTQPMETWAVEGCFLQNIDFSESDYATSEPVQVTLTIRPDNCLQSGGDGDGSGSSVAGGSGTIDTFANENPFADTANPTTGNAT